MLHLSPDTSRRAPRLLHLTMPTTVPLTPGRRLAIGLVFVVAGLPIMALATGLITPRPGSLHAPEWVLFMAGFSFSMAGTLFLLPESWIKLRGFLGGLLVTAFASIFDWVAFGPGERRFSGGLSIGPVFTSSGSSELSGRIWFGIAGVLISCFALWAWLRWLRTLFQPGSAHGDSE
jgi:hypothetical protein